MSHTMEVNGFQCCLNSDVPQNILFCVLQKKVSHTGLEQHKGVYPFKFEIAWCNKAGNYQKFLKIVDCTTQ